MNSAVTVRQRILDAAVEIVEEQGIKALTQPRVANRAGVRQSHLTYYFPRKADLFIALLQASHDRTPKRRRARSARETFDDEMRSLKQLILDRRRMRFFLGIVLEVSEEDDLRPILTDHAHALAARVAPQFGRAGDDPAVTAFIDSLRGIGLRMLIETNESYIKGVDVEQLARSFGLKRAADK